MDAMTTTIIGLVPVILAVAMVVMIARNLKDGYSVDRMKEAIGGIVMLLVALMVIFAITGGGTDPDPGPGPDPETTYSVLFSVASDSAGYGTVSLTDIRDVPEGTRATLGQTISIGSLGKCTARPAASTSQYSYAFAGWTGADDATTAAPTTITKDTHYYAHFTRTEVPPETELYSVYFHVASDSAGYGTVAPEAILNVPDGTAATIGQTISVSGMGQSAATPSASTEAYVYAFAGWTGADDASTAAPTTITKDTHYYAHFTRTLREYDVYFHVASDSAGYGTVSNSGITGVAFGTAATIGQTIAVGDDGSSTALAVPDSADYSYEFAGWTGADDATTAAPTAITADTHYYAHFTRTEASQGYLYAINSTGLISGITSVQASTDGSELRTISEARTSSDVGSANIADFWDFDQNTGIGPFNSFYAAFNIEDNPGMAAEAPVSTDAGRMAYRLNPYNLTVTMDGAALEGDYNVFLVIPTVYIKIVKNATTDYTIFMSSSDEYTYGTTTVSGMTPTAHTATSDGESAVWPYLGLAVYEASLYNGAVISAMEATPFTAAYDVMKSHVDALTSPEGSAFQMWNLYQVTLYRMMAMAIMGTPNSQAMLGDGYASSNESVDTGETATLGPWPDASATYSKLLIENSWGGESEFLGDTTISYGPTYDYIVYGNALGGAAFNSITGPQIRETKFSSGWVNNATYSPVNNVFGVKSSTTTSNADDLNYPGDYVKSYTTTTQSNPLLLSIGGNSNNNFSSRTHAGIFEESYAATTLSLGARIAYMIAEDAIDPTAPADRTLSRMVPAKLSAEDAYRLTAAALEDELAVAEESVRTMEEDPETDSAELSAAREEIERIRTSLADTRTQMKTLSAGGLSPAPSEESRWPEKQRGRRPGAPSARSSAPRRRRRRTRRPPASRGTASSRCAIPRFRSGGPREAASPAGGTPTGPATPTSVISRTAAGATA